MCINSILCEKSCPHCIHCTDSWMLLIRYMFFYFGPRDHQHFTEMSHTNLIQSFHVKQQHPNWPSCVDCLIGRFRMASAVISVPTTASRFALLQIDSDSDTDSDAGKPKAGRGAGKPRSGKSPSGKTNQNADKKKEKRRRKKEQQQSEANEVYLPHIISLCLSI